MAKDWKTLIADVESDEKSLLSRNDADLELYRLADYVLQDSKGEAIEDVTNETSAIPQIFANNLISELCGSSRQIVIDGDLTDKQKADIVEWLETFLQAVDEYLLLIDSEPLFDALCGQVALRGRDTVLVYPYIEEGVIIPHVVSWDSRYVIYQPSKRDRGWAVYKMTRSKGAVEAEYPDLTLSATGTTPQVWDCWDAEVNEVLVASQEAKSEKHGLGFCPVIREKVHASPFVRDSKYKEFESESIYAATRKVFPTLNRYRTIAASLGMKSLLNGLQFPNEQGANAQIEDPFGDRKVNLVGPNDRYLPMPIEDLRQSTQAGMKAAEMEIRMGTLPMLELGEIRGDNTLPQITQANDVTRKMLGPRIRTLERTYQRLCRMVITIVNKREMGSIREFMPGIELKLPQAKLEADFTIKCQITSVAPLENIARYNMAALAAPYRPRHAILTDILRVENPEDEILEMNEERVEAMSPKLSTWKAAVRNLKSKDKEEQAEGGLLALELGLTGEQVTKGEVPEVPGGNGQQPTGATPGQGGMASQGKTLNTRMIKTAAKAKGG